MLDRIGAGALLAALLVGCGGDDAPRSVPAEATRLLPFWSEAGPSLRLLDPTQAVSANNPRIADSGPGLTANIRLAPRADAPGANPQYDAVYLKQGQLYRVPGNAGSNAVPVQVSALTQVQDFSIVSDRSGARSWIVTTEVGSPRFLVSAIAPATAEGVPVTGAFLAAPIRDAGGNVTGFLAAQSDGSVPSLVKIDLGGTTTVIHAGEPARVFADRPGKLLVLMPAATESDLQVQRYDAATASLSDPVVTGPFGPIATGVGDGTHFYFSDDSQLQRVRLDPPFAEPEAVTDLQTRVDGLYDVTEDRVLFLSSTFSAETGGTIHVHSIDKLASRGQAQELVATTSGTGSLRLVRIAGGRLYYDRSGGGETDPDRAGSLRIDGTGSPATFESSQWIDAVPSEMEYLSGNTGAAWILLETSDGPAPQAATLRLVDAGSGQPVRTLGSILSPAQPVSLSGFGRYAGLTARIARDADHVDADAFAFDMLTDGSLRPVMATPGVAEFAVPAASAGEEAPSPASSLPARW
jgi:hypothetical protein